MPQTAKAKTAQFTKKKTSIIKKAYQLGRLYNADVALIIRKNGIYYTYRLTDRILWPLTTKEIVRIRKNIGFHFADWLLA